MRGRKLLMLVLVPLALLPAACAKTMVSAGTECRMFIPIRWSPADTDDTIRQAKAHNAAGKAACGWKGN